MSRLPNNIRVFVQWTEPTVFAGEDIECQITFRNIATHPGPSRTIVQPNAAGGFYDKQRKPAPSQLKVNSSQSARSALSNKSHRTTLSLNVPVGSTLQQPTRGLGSEGPSKSVAERPPHKRSVSIISIAATENGIDGSGGLGNGERPRRASKGHGRSASLQIVPRKQAVNGASSSALTNQRSSTQPSPLISSFSPTGIVSPQSERPSKRQPGITTAPNTPSIPSGPFTRKKGSSPLPHPFKFPAISNASSDTRSQADSIPDGPFSPRLKANTSTNGDQAAHVARILSPASVAGTPRSSGEFYSVSNNSTETLASEYHSQQNVRGPAYTGHTRRPSNLPTSNYHKPPETLMMGYAQIHGSFILDPSLVDQGPFEEIKRKGAIGGQGGGVIGVETNKRDSGLLRSFGWGNIGDSLGGLLGGSELSSMKDMRGIASSKSIPLLSTPQSILFVDLRLGPGESRSYKYGFKLPRGLPPSHRGKAIKISYKLVIGIQRPGGAKEQQVKSVEIPFRILGSVNSYGELLGHDLMSPYIILQDQARVRATQESLSDSLAGLRLQNLPKPSNSTQNQFLEYVDELLIKARQDSSVGLLSPSEMPRSRRQSHIEEPATAREAIDMAILRSNVATESHQSANRFEIARSGKRVAVVMLARPSYRLGETINATIDFTDAEIPCYAIHASLESSEKVQPSFSLRSEASILRVTRKTHASQSESTIFARRIVFSPTIPVSATPEFITSGVSLDWRVRVEFVTPRLRAENEEENFYPELLEEIARDDRGVMLAAAEVLDCESFEIAVPLRVYGAIAPNAEQNDAAVDGLAV